jgi:hypothetical protein
MEGRDNRFGERERSKEEKLIKIKLNGIKERNKKEGASFNKIFT